ncbi:glucuronate isomerase [Urechidicola vernalis]|uniref:Uronate isomerase n=1 Tax=Urechidicola vernalis TaxID=3075600 RepID=A0ABU2Y3T4_9FLAO|nr:glucuronate isomerase [Urechidicola sp. P050]MDT0552862.1 glucuronate isomerase [Urechidicola sp. P050]
MSIINSSSFITADFLLESEIAKKLFFEYAIDMPIIDYHNHLSAKQIAENEPLKNITDTWLSEDHYKWRGMRANGIDEEFITGNASKQKKFQKWAATVPYTVRNPLFHWTQLELKQYFNIDEILQPSNADEIYHQTNQILETRRPTDLLEAMKVEVVCTTDDPLDDLKYHALIAQKEYETKVYPTFRPDNLFLIGQDNFIGYIEKLKKMTPFEITNFETFVKAIDLRIDFFDKHGCKLSDFGISGKNEFIEFTNAEVEIIFQKGIKEANISEIEVSKYRSALFLHLGKKYHEKRWVQQYHLGPIRNNNSRLLKLVGADAGCDSIGDYSFAEFMSALFNKLDASDQLAKTITYNLNPAHNEIFATMMGNFNSGATPGKMQWGAAWWFLDQKDGIESQLNILSNIGLLSRFVGMLTDSRSLLSFPRHEYFRRILCNLLAKDIEKGLIPNDIEFIGKLVQDICYNNAKAYFNFDN